MRILDPFNGPGVFVLFFFRAEWLKQLGRTPIEVLSPRIWLSFSSKSWFFFLLNNFFFQALCGAHKVVADQAHNAVLNGVKGPSHWLKPLQQPTCRWTPEPPHFLPFFSYNPRFSSSCCSCPPRAAPASRPCMLLELSHRAPEPTYLHCASPPPPSPPWTGSGGSGTPPDLSHSAQERWRELACILLSWLFAPLLFWGFAEC